MLSPQPTDVRTAIADYLRQRFPTLALDRADDATALIGSGAIDSLGILELTAFLTERFGIEIADADFEPENFETLGRLIRFVERKQS